VIAFLAWRNLVRHRVRTVLTVLGLAVSTALLYDMALLAGGMRASLDTVLAEIGYELRVLPRGGLPFSSEATLPGGRRLAARLDSLPGVAAAVPLWATTLYLEPAGAATGREPLAAFALGIDPAGQTLYRIERGTALGGDEAAGPPGVVINALVADSLGVSLGDTLRATTALDATAGAVRPARLVVRAIADFRFDLAGQRSVSLALADLQRLAGRRAEDPAAFLLGKLEPGADGERVAGEFGRLHPEVDARSVADLLSDVRGQLSYFQQFSLILGTVSLLVTFLLILTLLTLSVNERQGEIAILRALGLTAGRIVALVLVEGLAFTLLAIGPGLALGTLASGGLDAILRSSPGLPPDLSFFAFTPGAVARTVGLVLVTGTVAGAYPALLAARTDIVRTLHQEVT
jgi:putative ABC transport system permease protein